jgi:hypothetical protein
VIRDTQSWARDTNFLRCRDKIFPAPRQAFWSTPQSNWDNWFTDLWALNCEQRTTRGFWWTSEGLMASSKSSHWPWTQVLFDTRWCVTKIPFWNFVSGHGGAWQVQKIWQQDNLDSVLCELCPRIFREDYSALQEQRNLIRCLSLLRWFTWFWTMFSTCLAIDKEWALKSKNLSGL